METGLGDLGCISTTWWESKLCDKMAKIKANKREKVGITKRIPWKREIWPKNGVNQMGLQLLKP